MSVDERQAIVDEAAATAKAAEDEATAAIEKLQAEYERVTAVKEEKIKASNSAELRLMKTIVRNLCTCTCMRCCAFVCMQLDSIDNLFGTCRRATRRTTSKCRH
jgi:hypothetical protein